MRELGMREWTALGALLFAVVLGFVFLDPANGESGGSVPRRQGDVLPTSTSTPGQTATAEPPSALPKPQNWEIQFSSITNGREVPENARVLPDLSLTFERAPFPDFRDNSWKVTARTSIELGAGSSLFILRYDAALKVYIDDRLVTEKPEPSAAEDVVITFPHESGRFEIRVEATDLSGVFLLQYKQ